MRVSITDTSGKPPLRAGMSVDVEINTGRARGLPNFIARLFGSTEHV
jgi:membrane fusion protein (multidrug efflux system)